MTVFDFNLEKYTQNQRMNKYQRHAMLTRNLYQANRLLVHVTVVGDSIYVASNINKNYII